MTDKIKEILEEFDEVKMVSFPPQCINFVGNTKDGLQYAGKQENIKSHQKELLKAVVKLIDEKLTEKKDYDGNDLESACRFHSIFAGDWAEIIRYEDGQKVALLDLSNEIKEIII